jgi:hypothetical protein
MTASGIHEVFKKAEGTRNQLVYESLHALLQKEHASIMGQRNTATSYTTQQPAFCKLGKRSYVNVC